MYGQDNDNQVFDFFAIQKGNHVLLHFTIGKGVDCNGVSIEKSFNGDTFELLHHIPGICGESASDETYYYTDSLPTPNVANYYRINLGGFIFSEVISIVPFHFNKKHYYIKNNPTSQYLEIYWEDDFFDKNYQISIFDIHGNRVMTHFQKRGHLNLSVSHLSSGLYVFEVTNNQRRVTGKFIKL